MAEKEKRKKPAGKKPAATPPPFVKKDEVKAAKAGAPPPKPGEVEKIYRGKEVPAFIKEKRQAHPFFRRFITITSAVGILVVVILFLTLPNIVTFQPRFCEICHKKVYNTWKTSTHAKTGCLSCHVGSGLENMVLSRVGLAQEIWMTISPKEEREKPIGFVSPPTNEQCLPCHEARRRISPSGDVVIPHQSHIKIRKLDCVECHEKFVCVRTGKGKAIVTMEGCYRCHNGRKATDECTACHTEKAAPPSHREKWVLQHGPEAQANKKECEDCHSKPKDFCKTCHGQKPPSHTAEFGVSHSLLAQQNRAACLECHEEQVTCAKCHGATGQQHEVGWRAIHPNIAKKGIRTCFDCHAKQHCNRCHRAPQ